MSMYRRAGWGRWGRCWTRFGLLLHLLATSYGRSHLHAWGSTKEEEEEVAGDDTVDEDGREAIYYELFGEQVIGEIGSYSSKDDGLDVHHEHISHIQILPHIFIDVESGPADYHDDDGDDGEDEVIEEVYLTGVADTQFDHTTSVDTEKEDDITDEKELVLEGTAVYYAVYYLYGFDGLLEYDDL